MNNTRRELLIGCSGVVAALGGCFGLRTDAHPSPSVPLQFAYYAASVDEGVDTVAITYVTQPGADHPPADKIQVVIGETTAFDDGAIVNGFDTGTMATDGWANTLQDGDRLILSKARQLEWRKEVHVYYRHPNVDEPILIGNRHVPKEPATPTDTR